MTELAQEFRILGPGAAIENNSVGTYYLGDRRLRVSIARVDGQLYAFDDLCTCAQPACPLSGGMLAGKIITCQCHGSQFDVATGAVIRGPAKNSLNVYEALETNGDIKLRA